MKRCLICYKEFPDDHLFCSVDGGDLEPYPITDFADRDEDAAERPSQRFRFARVGVVLLASVRALWFYKTGWGGLRWTVFRLTHISVYRPSYSPAYRRQEPELPVITLPPIPERAPPVTREEEWMTYTDAELHFSLSYPRAWSVKRVNHPGRIRVQFDATPEVYVGMDVSPSPQNTFEEWKKAHGGVFFSQDMESRFRKQHGGNYERLGLGTATWDGVASEEWRFTVQKPMEARRQSRQVVTIVNHRAFGILLTAPDAEFARWEPLFKRLFESVHFTDNDQGDD